MIEAQIYRGIEFIRLADLPTTHREAILAWASRDQIIKILKEDNTLLNDCIQYKDYEYWYRNELETETITAKSGSSAKRSSVRLAVGR